MLYYLVVVIGTQYFYVDRDMTYEDCHDKVYQSVYVGHGNSTYDDGRFYAKGTQVSAFCQPASRLD